MSTETQFEQISMLDALACNNEFPHFESTAHSVNDSDRRPPASTVPLFAQEVGAEFYTVLVDKLLKKESAVKLLGNVLISNSTQFCAHNEAGVTAVANELLFNVACKGLLAYIHTMTDDQRKDLGYNFTIMPQDYIVASGGVVILDLKFVRIFHGKPVNPKDVFLVVEMKAYGHLKAESYDSVQIGDNESVPDRTLFRGMSGKHLEQLSNYCVQAKCKWAVMADLSQLHAYHFHKMGDSDKIKIGESCMRTSFGNIDEHRRGLTGILIASWTNDTNWKVVDPPLPPSRPSLLAGGQADPSRPQPPRRSPRNGTAGTTSSRGPSPASDALGSTNTGRTASPLVLPERRRNKPPSIHTGSNSTSRNASPHSGEPQSRSSATGPQKPRK